MNPDFTKLTRFPLGMVLPYAGPTNVEDIQKFENNGWYLCDGRRVSTRLPLFNVIGHLYGEADGVNFFHLPDYRGVFLRGVDNPTGTDGAGRDPDISSRNAISNSLRSQVGSTQDDAFKSHNHDIAIAHAGGGDWDRDGGANRVSTSSTATSSSGSSETRPKNIYINYLIFGGKKH